MLRCPTQGPAASITIYQYLVVLKLISWPILFALFARTAKEVDEEADHIWKYQLYSLAVDFRFVFIYILFIKPEIILVSVLFFHHHLHSYSFCVYYVVE
jgi:hypothetical protein